MKKRNMMGVDPKFKALLFEIKVERLKKGKDNKPLSDRQLTEEIAKVYDLRGYLTGINVELKRRGYK